MKVAFILSMRDFKGLGSRADLGDHKFPSFESSDPGFSGALNIKATRKNAVHVAEDTDDP